MSIIYHGFITQSIVIPIPFLLHSLSPLVPLDSSLDSLTRFIKNSRPCKVRPPRFSRFQGSIQILLTQSRCRFLGHVDTTSIVPL